MDTVFRSLREGRGNCCQVVMFSVRNITQKTTGQIGAKSTEKISYVDRIWLNKRQKQNWVKVKVKIHTVFFADSLLIQFPTNQYENFYL